MAKTSKMKKTLTVQEHTDNIKTHTQEENSEAERNNRDKNETQTWQKPGDRRKTKKQGGQMEEGICRSSETAPSTGEVFKCIAVLAVEQSWSGVLFGHNHPLSVFARQLKNAIGIRD